MKLVRQPRPGWKYWCASSGISGASLRPTRATFTGSICSTTRSAFPRARTPLSAAGRLRTVNSTPPAVAPRPSLDGLLQAIKRERPRLQSYLPDGLSIDRFEALLERQVRNNPRLAECSIHKRAARRLATQRRAACLSIRGEFSTLISATPREGRQSAPWDPTYRGLIAQALASGFVVDVQSGVVRSNDFFEFNEGSGAFTGAPAHVAAQLGRCDRELGDGQAQHGAASFWRYSPPATLRRFAR